MTAYINSTDSAAYKSKALSIAKEYIGDKSLDPLHTKFLLSELK